MRRTAATWALCGLAIVVFVYGLVLLNLVLFQRNLMYFPAKERAAVPRAILPEARSMLLATPDGERIVAWYQKPRAGRPLILYFHGNAGSLRDRADLFRRLTVDGSGFLAIDYRGYGGSTGSPSETGLIRDGQTAFGEAVRLGNAPEQIVIIGESLGSAVAIAVATDRSVRALVLDSAFSSAADVAAEQYRLFPVRFLMKDPFNSLARIGQVTAPKLFLHGTLDSIIPVHLGRRLFEAAPPPKTFLEFPGMGHVVLGAPHVLQKVQAWLASLPSS